MDEETIRESWDACELEELEKFNGFSISPAVFELEMDEEFVFEDRPFGDFWEALKSMDDVAFTEGPLDGRIRGNVYVATDEESGGYVSFRSYPERIRVSPADDECPYEAYRQFITEFEEAVCGLRFMGSLKELNS